MSASLNQVEAELKQFLEYCKENGLNDEQITTLFATLSAQTEKGLCKKFVLAAFIVLIALYMLSYFEYFSWHYTALGRIFMIKLLPLYDWQRLKGETCLIPNTKNVFSTPKIDCFHCETLHTAPYSQNTQPDFVKTKYLDIDVPVVLPYSFRSNYTDAEKILEDLIKDPNYYGTVPCKIASNIPTQRLFVTGEILEKVSEHEAFFLHYQNCEFEGVKAFRRIFHRPDFHAAEISPVQYSWLLIYRDYEAGKYRRIFLKDRTATLVQVIGEGAYKLTPISECAEDCLSLDVHLQGGEALVITAPWDLDYRPIGDGLAVILETH